MADPWKDSSLNKEEAAIERETVWSPLLPSAPPIPEANAHSFQKLRTDPITEKKSARKGYWRCGMGFCGVLIVVASFVIFVTFSPVDVKTTVETSSGEEANSIIFAAGNTTKLTVYSKSWNAWSCSSWDWELSGTGPLLKLRGHDVQFTVEESAAYTSVSVSCVDYFGHISGKAQMVLHVGVLKSNVVTLHNESEIVICPSSLTDELKVTPNFAGMLSVGTMIYSTACSGMVVEVVDLVDPLVGLIAVSNDTSLENVVAALNIPPTPVPYHPFVVSRARQRASFDGVSPTVGHGFGGQ